MILSWSTSLFSKTAGVKKMVHEVYANVGVDVYVYGSHLYLEFC
jgi:hypothetical protein